MLVIPYFSGASFVYRQFIRSYISQSLHIWKWNISPVNCVSRESDFVSCEQEKFVDVVTKNIFDAEVLESEKHISCQVVLCCEFMFILVLKTTLSMCVCVSIYITSTYARWAKLVAMPSMKKNADSPLFLCFSKLIQN